MMDEEILVLTNDIEKKCVKCGRILPTTAFYGKKDARDGLQSWCKECHSLYHKSRGTHTQKVLVELNDVRLGQLYQAAKNAGKSYRKSVITFLRNLIEQIEKI